MRESRTLLKKSVAEERTIQETLAQRRAAKTVKQAQAAELRKRRSKMEALGRSFNLKNAVQSTQLAPAARPPSAPLASPVRAAGGMLSAPPLKDAPQVAEPAILRELRAAVMDLVGQTLEARAWRARTDAMLAEMRADTAEMRTVMSTLEVRPAFWQKSRRACQAKLALSGATPPNGGTPLNGAAQHSSRTPRSPVPPGRRSLSGSREAPQREFSRQRLPRTSGGGEVAHGHGPLRHLDVSPSTPDEHLAC